MDEAPPSAQPAVLVIDADFLAQWRDEAIAYAHDYFMDADTRTEALPPTPALMAWFIGLDGEPEAEVLARVLRTVQWLDNACPLREHEIEDIWSFDAFRYGLYRFGTHRDHAKATAGLMPFCLALRTVLNCKVCWPRILNEAPYWTSKTTKL